MFIILKHVFTVKQLILRIPDLSLHQPPVFTVSGPLTGFNIYYY